MQPKYETHRYHLLFPNIFGFKGGEQVYNNFLLCSLKEVYPNSQITVFLKRDKNFDEDNFTPKNVQFYCFGHLFGFLQILVFSVYFIVLGIIQRPKVVISSHINFSPICYCLYLLTGIPFWIVAHGLEIWQLKGPLRRLSLHHAERTLAVSMYTFNRLLKEQNLDSNKVFLLRNTFDAGRFNLAPKPQRLLTKYGLKSNQPIILTVTRLAPYKGYDKILHALPYIRYVIPNLHYVLVGKGEDKQRIEALIKKLELQNCVTLVGFVSDQELCDYYNLCDVFAMPSCGEGFGIVFLEALACGKPVLAGNQDGSIEPLLNGQLGCLVDPNNIHQIAYSLTQILSGNYANKLLYKPEKLRKKVLEEFGLTRFKSRLHDLISINQ
ncbi:MAG: glycosyltransferase [Cyanobacteria bacterium P01_D01_bin.156]